MVGPTLQANRAPVARHCVAAALVACVWSYGCAGTPPPPAASIPAWRPAPQPVIVQPNPQPVPTAVPQTPPQVPAASSPWTPITTARAWKYIVLHHTASESGDVASIHEEHLQRKDSNGKNWLGIGYHFVIGNGNGMGDGEVEPTFRWREQLHGAHAGSDDPVYNQAGIGIVLVGNFEERAPTPAQLSAVKELVGSLKAEYHIPTDHVIGHRDVRATECPGKLFPLAEVAALTEPNSSLSQHPPRQSQQLARRSTSPGIAP